MKTSNSSPRYWVVIPAAGRGSRFGSELPKQYCELAGRRVIEHSINVFLKRTEFSAIVVALHPEDTLFQTLSIATDSRIRMTTGGSERADSVERALQTLVGEAHDDDWVLVHDAARPCLSDTELSDLLAGAAEADHGALLALPVVDTVKRVGEGLNVEETVDRSQLWRALTPQMFRYRELCNALSFCRENALTVTDESSAMEQVGQSPVVVQGSHCNIKITYQADLQLAAYFLAEANLNKEPSR
jgi:2-C-methyl-D-erythritol 4-phosphate cytidylyltransferase